MVVTHDKTWNFQIGFFFFKKPLIELEEHFGRTIHVHLPVVKWLYFSWPQFLVERNEKNEITSEAPSNSNNFYVLGLYKGNNSVNIQIGQNFKCRLPEVKALRDQACNIKKETY